MNLNLKIRLLQLLAHIGSLIGIWYVFTTAEYYWLLFSFIIWIIIGPISQVITLHRFLAHKSFRLINWLKNILCLLSVLSTVGPTISWVSIHRMHHAKTDTDADPHSPNINGKKSFIRALQVLIGYKWKVSKIETWLVKDLLKEQIHVFIFKNYFKIILFYITLLAIINPILIIFMYFLPVTGTVLLVGTVNVLGHMHGYRTYTTRDCSTNSWIANILSMGDGWHNNHHANPQNYKTGEKWWEWDLMAIIIDKIKV